MLKRVMIKSSLVALAVAISMSAHAIADSPKQINVPAGDLVTALESLAKQADVELVYQAEQLRGLHTGGVSGTFTTQDAVKKLIEGTLLRLRTDDATGAMLITPPVNRSEPSDKRKEQTAGSSTSAASSGASSSTTRSESKSFWKSLRLARAESDKATTTDASSVKTTEQRVELEEVVVGVPEVLVKGSKILNLDIPRTRDDAQPYVIFDRAAIERAGANNVEDFLKSRLTMNSTGYTNNRGNNVIGGSAVNLRGLGAAQTLILVDGRRVGGATTSVGPQQANLNGIPLTAIERIEVLPTTASGIYGGSATGGVINIVLRRDYVGVETKLTYGNTFQSDMANPRADIGAGFSLEGGRTNVLLAGSFSKTSNLQVGDRNLYERGRNRMLANDPGFFLDSDTPPLGAVPNIRSSNGQNLVLKPAYGATNLGSAFTTVPDGYSGVASGVSGLVANAGHYNFGLGDTAHTDGGRGNSLFGEQTLKSGMLTVRRQFSSAIQAFVDLEASGDKTASPFSFLQTTYGVPRSAPNNPFDQDVNVTVPSSSADGDLTLYFKDRRVVGGVIAQLPGKWSLEADYTWDRVKNVNLYPPDLGGPQSAGFGAALANGTVDVFRDPRAFPLDVSPFLNTGFEAAEPYVSTLRNISLHAAGPIIELPGGPLTLNALIEHRTDHLDDELTVFPDGRQTLFPSRGQKVDSAYLELTVPLVSAANRLTGIDELDVQLAGRRDEYSVDGVNNSVPIGTAPVRARNETSSNNPTLGLRYRPVQSLLMRASYGTGFLPPSVQQLIKSAPRTARINDPRRNNLSTPIQTTTGGNPDLRPEESESLSFGLVFEPTFMPGLRASVDYTHIDKTDNIRSLGQQGVVNNETFLPGRVVRGNPAADPLGIGIITFVDSSLVNVSRTKFEAYDATLDYQTGAHPWGSLQFFGAATWTQHLLQQIQPVQPFDETVGESTSNPVKFKANVGLTWMFRQWNVGWNTSYYGHYMPDVDAVTLQLQGARFVKAQVYHDVFATYDFDRGNQDFLGGVQVQAGVKNLFNTRPPFDAGGGLLYSYYGDPRLASYYFSVRKAF